ncbi:hypothetical protein OBBRIDRAFT_794790 [Obba rivulosa]|uniref:DUF6533 domain-containing protein n=1 Tax=Obba rivulosa TaxID=1052685 RepID=A0A8E2DN35_9APHY|nr:hypothetical protein OBBRIDRAFT_794790 [Obba rivulosa]
MASSQAAEEIADSLFTNYAGVAINVVVIYEHLTTSSMEVDVIWSRKLTSFTTILFLVNRYNTVVNSLISLVLLILPANGVVCYTGAINTISILISFIVWATFSAFRVYSINGRNMLLPVMVFILGLVPFGTNLYLTAMQILTTSAVEGICMMEWNLSETADDIVAVTTRASLILSDILILYITLSKTYSLYGSRGSSQVKSSLVKLLVRDGAFYFVSLLILHCVQMTLWIKNEFQTFSLFTTP